MWQGPEKKILNYAGFIEKIYFISIWIWPISISKNIFFAYKNNFLSEKLKLLGFFSAVFSKYLRSSVILYITMIASEKYHQNISDYNQFLFNKIFEVNIPQNFSGEQMRNYLWLCTLVFHSGFLIQCAVLVFYMYIETLFGKTNKVWRNLTIHSQEASDIYIIIRLTIEFWRKLRLSPKDFSTIDFQDNFKIWINVEFRTTRY